MGIELPILPDAVLPLLPHGAQCVARVAAQQARNKGTGRMDAPATVESERVYVSYRRLGAALGLRLRCECERAVQGYLAAVQTVPATV